VVLATGDYSASDELKGRLVSPECASLPAINPSSTGDGHLMGLAVGAEIKNADRALEELRLPPAKGHLVGLVGWMPSSGVLAHMLRVAIERLPRALIGRMFRAVLTGYVAPSAALIRAGSILVNQDGQRFGSEEDKPARALARQRDNRCYLVFDADVADLVSKWPNPLSTFPGVAYAYLQDYARFRPDAVHRADTIQGLAKTMGVDAALLRHTIDRYNGAVRLGEDQEFGRRNLGNGILRPPFYAVGPLTGFVTLTDGGLAIDEECRVLDMSGLPIQGLYAVGSVGQGGLILANHGLHIAWAITSGRVAGRAALKHATCHRVASGGSLH
jgi:fumarate reductase flavoprotein subunit